MFCTKCGNEVAEGSAFCTKCGAPVAAPVGGGEAGGLKPAPTGAHGAGSAAPAPKKGGAKVGVVAAAVVVAVVLVAGFATSWFGLGGVQPKEAPEQPAAEQPETDAADGAENSAAGDPVAATVNGQDIMEQTVTDYIADFRESAGLESDEAWGAWMASNGYTPASVREEVIDHYIDQDLYERAAAEYDVVVEQEEIDAELQQTKDMFESDEAFQEALEAIGMTEEEYIEDTIRPTLLQAKLSEAVVGQGDDSDQAFATWFYEYKENTGITINPMPEGLPYAIDMAPYEEAADAAAAEAAGGADDLAA